jgi:hypothetical protein
VEERFGATEKTTMLNTGTNQATAKIYQFPAGGRSALGGRRYDETGSASDIAAAPRFNEALCSDSWYHEAAIRDAKPERDR